MTEIGSAAPPHAFIPVLERNTADNLLRTAQQHHVQLSTMADIKANIIITVSSIVMTLAIGRLGDPELRLAMGILVVCTLVAFLLAVMAVLPKYRPLRFDSTAELPPGFNLLFFGHFAELPQERFLQEVARRMNTDGSVYDTMARDLYALGYYLAHYKYRFLRLSYIFFLIGFVSAVLAQAWQLWVA